MAKETTIKGLSVGRFENEPTPFYFYDMDLLRRTLGEVKRLTAGKPVKVHFAVKANGNPRILAEVASHGLGADLVSGGEMKAALAAGFAPANMNYSGVGKTDWEIRLGLEHGIGCFNVESVPELEVINELAAAMDTTARVAIRVNPDIDAHTHKYITTGTADNKFGIGIEALGPVVDKALALGNVRLVGLHFHIGSQITQMQPYAMLCDTVNGLLDHYEARGVRFESVNMGGGLGIDYNNPDVHPLPPLEEFFGIFDERLQLRSGQELHFELGRAALGDNGALVSRVVYVKESRNRRFAILDAGMNDLLRPALYQASHAVQNLSAAGRAGQETYDVVGPVCESSDVFARDCMLPVTRRGDIVVIRSAGAYGESMASAYNMRQIPRAVFE